MAFGFGGSSSRSSSQSSSLDLGFNVQQSFSDSLAQSLSRSSGSSFGTQSVWNADMLERLYSEALNAAPDSSLFQGQAADLYSAGRNVIDELGAGAGEDYLTSRLTDTSARDAQLEALGGSLGEFFREELNPAITSRGVATGTLGGGRQGVAQAQAAQRVSREYSRGAADIIGRDQLARDQAATSLEALRTGRASTQLGALSPLLNVASAGLNANLAPYATLASIIGGPTVLTESGSQESSEATSESIARAISEAFGFNYGTSQSTSSSKGKSFNVGVGA